MSVFEQLAEYRRAKSLEYHRKERLAAIREKYNRLLVLDKTLLAGYKIAGFIERLPRFNYHFINDYDEDFLSKVPGRFRYRTFWEDGLYVYDLREIGPVCEANKERVEEVMKLYPPIEPYKVAGIVKQWFRVNPTTDHGLRFKQDMDYQQASVKDWLREGKRGDL
jgi:hypothetical protein